MNEKLKIRFLIMFLIVNLFTIILVSAIGNDVLNQDKGILFYGNGCPHCAKVESFIQDNHLENLIIRKEIYHNSTNAGEFNRLCDEKGINLMDRGVPFLNSLLENKICKFTQGCNKYTDYYHR